MKQITLTALDALVQQAKASPRRRANLNVHTRLDDPIQRLAIAMEPDTYVRPHRHPETWELLYPLTGRFAVLQFDATGTLSARAVLGAEPCRRIATWRLACGALSRPWCRHLRSQARP